MAVVTALSSHLEAAVDQRVSEHVTTEAGYSGTTAAKVVGITYRQLDYWARTSLVRQIGRAHV